MSDIVLGAFGTALAAALTIIGLLLRKLRNGGVDIDEIASNHLAHIADKLDSIESKLTSINTDIKLGIQTLDNVWYKVNKL